MNLLGKHRIYLVIGLQIGCSGTTIVTNNVSDSTGGSPNASSSATATGGTNPIGAGSSGIESGGASPMGGTGSGGTTSTTGAGTNATGGASLIASTTSGGAATGGASSIASMGTGGVVAGGTAPIGTGGAATGGVSPTGSTSSGGTATGGASSTGTGGIVTGGTAPIGTGGAATGGVNPTGSTSSGGTATGGASTSTGAVVAVLAGPWGDTSTNQSQVKVSIDSIDSPSFILVAVTANATDSAVSVAASTVAYKNLVFTRFVGGNIAGTAFASEFWGTRSTTVQLPATMTVTLSGPSNAGVHVWALSGVNSASPVGSLIEQGQMASNLYQVTFPNKRYGSLLFGAFFDTDYAQDSSGYLPIVAQAGSVVKQTYAAYSVWSSSAFGSGSQSIGASLPGRWTVEHSAIEIVP